MSTEIHYQRLNADNFTGYSLDDFVRHQTVTECWRKIAGDWKLVSNIYEENWSQVQCREIAEDVVHHINLDHTGTRASAGSSFQWLVKRPGGWVQINCTFRLIPQKSHRLHTGHLDAVSQKKSMRNWQQRSPSMSKWNTDYKRVTMHRLGEHSQDCYR